MRESKIEKRLRELVEENGGCCYKFTSSVAGVPDRVVILRGRTIFVEVKQEDGEISKIQQHTIEKMRAAGACVCVLWSIAEVEAFVRFLR